MKTQEEIRNEIKKLKQGIKDSFYAATIFLIVITMIFALSAETMEFAYEFIGAGGFIAVITIFVGFIILKVIKIVRLEIYLSSM